MKRILMALAVILAVQVAGAQVKNPETVKKALASAEAASKDAKKATDFVRSAAVCAAAGGQCGQLL